MRAILVAACLLLIAPMATAASGPTSGWGLGTVEEGETDRRHHNTHGDQPCLAIYIPKVFTVTLNHAPTDVLGLRAGGASATSQNGVATVSFVANYCTSFDIFVDGIDVDGSAAYAMTVTSVFTAPVA